MAEEHLRAALAVESNPGPARLDPKTMLEEIRRRQTSPDLAARPDATFELPTGPDRPAGQKDRTMRPSRPADPVGDGNR